MISISEAKVGDGAIAARISNRILTKDEYSALKKEDVMFLLGITDYQEYEPYEIVFKELFKTAKKADNPAKKVQLKEIDSELKKLQDAKKRLKEGK